MSDAPEPLQYRVEIREGYVRVWQRGLARSQAEIVAMQREIETAFREAGMRVALFDNRETEKPDEYVRAAMWTWLTQNVDRAALLQKSERNVRRADRTAERNRVSLRAFANEKDAEDWLLGLASLDE